MPFGIPRHPAIGNRPIDDTRWVCDARQISDHHRVSELDLAGDVAARNWSSYRVLIPQYGELPRFIAKFSRMSTAGLSVPIAVPEIVDGEGARHDVAAPVGEPVAAPQGRGEADSIGGRNARRFPSRGLDGEGRWSARCPNAAQVESPPSGHERRLSRKASCSAPEKVLGWAALRRAPAKVPHRANVPPAAEKGSHRATRRWALGHRSPAGPPVPPPTAGATREGRSPPGENI